MEKIALLFPGQGSQYVGMSKTLYEQYDIVRHTFAEANEILGFDLAKLCFEGSMLELAKVEHALPALLTSSVAAFRVYMKEVGIFPQFLAGHSLGEYSALTCSGAIRFADAVKLVQKRAALAKRITGTGTGAMTILSDVNVSMIEEACKNLSNQEQTVVLSCYNSSQEVAISGDLQAVQQVEDVALEAGAQVTPLMGTAPFHSPLMSSVADELRAELEQYPFSHIKWPVVSNVTGTIYEGADKIVDRLTQQILLPVRWSETMAYLERQGVTLAIELGAKNVLGNLLRLDTRIQTMCFDHKEDRRELIESFATRPEYSKHKPTVITKALAAAVATPNANFDEQAYREGVIEPYKKIQGIQLELEQTGADPSAEQMKEALVLLKKIFTTKEVTAEEQSEWYNQIFDETGTHYLFPEFTAPQAILT